MATEILVQPAEINFTFPFGDTWPITFELGSEEAAVYTPTDLTGATVRMQLRDNKNKLLADLNPVVTAPLLGIIDVTQVPSATKVAWSTAYYELELTYADGTRRTEVKGVIKVQNGGVTNDDH